MDDQLQFPVIATSPIRREKSKCKPRTSINLLRGATVGIAALASPSKSRLVKCSEHCTPFKARLTPCRIVGSLLSQNIATPDMRNAELSTQSCLALERGGEIAATPNHEIFSSESNSTNHTLNTEINLSRKKKKPSYMTMEKRRSVTINGDSVKAKGLECDNIKTSKGKNVSLKDCNNSISQRIIENMDVSSSGKNNSARTSPIVDEILKETDYYKILGILERNKMSVHVSTIQKAYRRRALLTHPDKLNGDRKAFDKVAEAYDVLSDDRKRSIYDRLGSDGIGKFSTSSASGGLGSAEDFFRSFFGNTEPLFNFGNRQQQYKRNRTIQYQLAVSLEDMYHGSVREVELREHYDPFNPNSQAAFGKDYKSLEVQIPKGALEGQTIICSGAMDFNTDDTPADIVFVLKQSRHSIYERKGYDLACRMDISLSDALCGLRRTIQHISGKSITISSTYAEATKKSLLDQCETSTSSGTSNSMAPSSNSDHPPMLIETGTVRVLKGYGMPKDSSGQCFGDLYIHFQVQTPNNQATLKNATDSTSSMLTTEERTELRRLLQKMEGSSSRDADNATDSEGILFLQPASLSDFGSDKGHPRLNENQEHDTFGNGGQYSSFSPFGIAGEHRYYWSSSSRGTKHSFSSPASNDSNDEETQCRQM